MKETDGLVSVILPAYNAEAYIETCIGSIVAQTYRNWELLIIDDGSTDRTPEICARFAEADARIKLIRQANKGVSAARNVGLAHARGQYLAFVDADDYLEQDSLLRRVELIDGADLLVCGYARLSEGVRESRVKVCSRPMWEGEEIAANIAVPGELGYQGFLWNKLFRRSIIEENALRFAEGIAYNEDRLFCVAYALHCQKAALSDAEVYIYRRTENGAMASVARMNDAEYRKYMSEFEAYDRMLEMLKGKPGIFRAVCKNAQNRAAELSRLAPRDQKTIRRGIKEQLRKYSLLLLTAPGAKRSLTGSLKLLGHAVLMK